MLTEDGHTRPSRRLAAILAADVAGYSTLMGADEARARFKTSKGIRPLFFQ
jgi:class 3 adenylate cyclase